jgi:hypothetical protein
MSGTKASGKRDAAGGPVREDAIMPDDEEEEIAKGGG